MTLLPANDFGITGWPGNHYELNEICAHPQCNRRSAQGHHMWPRSFIRKDYDWVRLPDGTILGNRVGLCVEHHEMVTGEIGGYRAKLVWEAGIMWWEGKDPDLIAPLTTQPPVAGINAVQSSMVELQQPAHGHVTDEEKVCPVCGHHKHRQEPRAKLERRNTKQWTVTVPDDAEIGSDVLDNWIEDFAIPLGAGDWSSRLKRYHVLCAVLAWATVNRSEFIADLAEAAERRVSA